MKSIQLVEDTAQRLDSTALDRQTSHCSTHCNARVRGHWQDPGTSPLAGVACMRGYLRGPNRGARGRLCIEGAPYLVSKIAPLLQVQLRIPNLGGTMARDIQNGVKNQKSEKLGM